MMVVTIMLFLLMLVSALQPTETAASSRPKRAFLGYCPNGALAVAMCFPNRTCGAAYYCDTFTNRCCPGPYVPIIPPVTSYPTIPPLSPFTIYPTYPTFPPSTSTPRALICLDGNRAESACSVSFPQCPASHICTARGLCCRSGTAASCNFRGLPTKPCPLGKSECSQQEYCSVDHYCCPSTN
ncbi:unnamed protein product [Soboliphyme baturini]|uniref:GRANULINS domain-containing protein n=1 Tax=Soboliphyme baturini TaxID=241478 RepID=A0A183J9Z6_9BILA|nr:unnamed protein product [Soboliphyme baturini]